MKPLDRWKLVDEVSLHEATMLILNIEPHRFEDPSDKFSSEKYNQIYVALKRDIEVGKLQNNNPAKPHSPNNFEPFVSFNNLTHWIAQNDISAPFFERLRISKPVTSNDLINLILLSKVIALWYNMKVSEACDWMLDTITELSIYGIRSSCLPEKIEKTRKLFDLLTELINSQWWDYPENLHTRFVGYEFSLNELAVLRSEAFLLFDLPFPEINDVLQKIEDGENQPNTCNSDVNNSIFKLDTPAEYVSNELKVLNKAAFEFWSSADPDDKTTHPTNDEVSEWLKKQGFSDISAKQGAVIIRPEWAASGRRPTK